MLFMRHFLSLESHWDVGQHIHAVVKQLLWFYCRAKKVSPQIDATPKEKHLWIIFRVKHPSAPLLLPLSCKNFQLNWIFFGLLAGRNMQFEDVPLYMHSVEIRYHQLDKKNAEYQRQSPVATFPKSKHCTTLFLTVSSAHIPLVIMLLYTCRSLSSAVILTERTKTFITYWIYNSVQSPYFNLLIHSIFMTSFYD